MKDFKPDLMIFDPFQAYIGAEINMNAPNETRDKLNRIADLAEKYDVAVVLICHFNKNGKGDAITRFSVQLTSWGSAEAILHSDQYRGKMT